MDAAAGSGKHAPGSVLRGRRSRLARDGQAEPISQDQILGREREHEKFVSLSPIQLTTNRNDNIIRLIRTLQ